MLKHTQCAEVARSIECTWYQRGEMRRASTYPLRCAYPELTRLAHACSTDTHKTRNVVEFRFDVYHGEAHVPNGRLLDRSHGELHKDAVWIGGVVAEWIARDEPFARVKCASWRKEFHRTCLERYASDVTRAGVVDRHSQ